MLVSDNLCCVDESYNEPDGLLGIICHGDVLQDGGLKWPLHLILLTINVSTNICTFLMVSDNLCRVDDRFKESDGFKGIICHGDV